MTKKLDFINKLNSNFNLKLKHKNLDLDDSTFIFMTINLLVFIFKEIGANNEGNSNSKKMTLIKLNQFIDNNESNSPYFHVLEKIENKLSDKQLKEVVNIINQELWHCNELDNGNHVNPSILGLFIENLFIDSSSKNKFGTILRKKKGVYFTPSKITKYIVHQSFNHYLTNKCFSSYKIKFNFNEIDKIKSKELINYLITTINNIKLLDPSCGSGEFILESINYLNRIYSKLYRQLFILDTGEKAKFELKLTKFFLNDVKLRNNDNLSTKLEKNSFFLLYLFLKTYLKIINGLDVNFAINSVCKVRIWLYLYYHAKRINEIDLLNEFNLNIFNELKIHEGNFLFGDIGDVSIENLNLKPYNFHNSKFNLIIGNPPYIRSRNISKRERNLFTNMYSFTNRTYDLFVLFFERSFQILDINGVIGFIVPESLLNQPYASLLRKEIMTNRILHIIEIISIQNDQLFFKAKIKTCIIFLEKNSRIKNYLVNLKLDENGFEFVQDLNYSKNWMNGPHYLFKLELNDENKKIIENIEENTFPLKNIYLISKGIEIFQKNGDRKKRSFISKDSQFSNDSKKYIEGRDLGRYQLNSRNLYLSYEPEIHYSPKFPELFENKKILMRRIIGKKNLIATIDSNNYYADNTIICLIQKYTLENILKFEKQDIDLSLDYSLELILAIINSSLINFYFKVKWSDKLQIYNYIIELFPIPIINLNQKVIILQIINNVKILMKINESKIDLNKTDNIDKELDQLVFKLYNINNETVKLINSFNLL